MSRLPKQPPSQGHQSTFHEKLVLSMITLEGFLSEIRTASGRDEILALAVRSLKRLLPIKTAAFYFPEEQGLGFRLHTALAAEAEAQLQAMVDQAIDSGVFGWALNHRRPAAFKAPNGGGTLVLAALRARKTVLGMFAAVLSTQSAAGWDANPIVLSTFLATLAEMLHADELTERLQDQNRQLNTLVQQRTQQLENARDAAEMASRAKSTFLATISHELRTPLNAILGYTQILDGEPNLNPTQREDLRTIRHSAGHLLSIINDLLDLTKAEASTIRVISARVEIGPLIEELRCLLKPQAEAKQLPLAFVVGTGVPASLTTDPKRLRQVLLNLMDNALKYTDRGSVNMELLRIGDAVRFSVSDTGCGIASYDIPKLFQPFQRLGDVSRYVDGSGLGLSITKRILHAMGAEIHVRSEKGKGSTFWFELKCDFEEVGTARAVTPAEADAEEPASALSHESIAALKQLSAQGDVLGLQRELEKIIAESIAPNPFVTRLLELAFACKIKAIRDKLENYEGKRS